MVLFFHCVATKKKSSLKRTLFLVLLLAVVAFAIAQVFGVPACVAHALRDVLPARFVGDAAAAPAVPDAAAASGAGSGGGFFRSFRSEV